MPLLQPNDSSTSHSVFGIRYCPTVDTFTSAEHPTLLSVLYYNTNSPLPLPRLVSQLAEDRVILQQLYAKVNTFQCSGNNNNIVSVSHKKYLFSCLLYLCHIIGLRRR